ncbi:hypothetical protein [Streptomyces sp. NPDC058486]|uniref:hypothetical protein n=1 Tax=unclassified Streptomyces TaxID=2593676 RepID=UPI0036651F52
MPTERVPGTGLALAARAAVPPDGLPPSGPAPTDRPPPRGPGRVAEAFAERPGLAWDALDRAAGPEPSGG